MRATHWRLALKVLPVALIAVGAKVAVHSLGWEVLELNPLFSGLFGATVFLIGFMIAGTLADYKESERLPSDLAASLHSITDECSIAAEGKAKKAAAGSMRLLQAVTASVLDWLRGTGTSEATLASLAQLSQGFVTLEAEGVQATFINRLKTEQNQVRRMFLRMQTIRDTSFVKSGYLIAELSTALLVIGLIFLKDQPYSESLYLIGFVTFVLTYMIGLIANLDNPFDYRHEDEGNEVSLKPLEQLQARLKQLTK